MTAVPAHRPAFDQPVPAHRLRVLPRQPELNHLFFVASLVAVPSFWSPVRCDPSRIGECTKILSRSVSVVDSIVEVKGEVDVGGTADFEVAELQNLIDVVDVEASHSSSDLDDDDVVGEDADAGDVDGDDVDRRSRCGSLEDDDGGDVDALGDDSSPC